jgi:hypothetical protein
VSEDGTESPIRIFLLFENRLLREALGRLLSKRTDLFVIGCSGPDGASAQALLESHCDVWSSTFLTSGGSPQIFD